MQTFLAEMATNSGATGDIRGDAITLLGSFALERASVAGLALVADVLSQVSYPRAQSPTLT